MGKVKRQTINLTGVYIACQVCHPLMRFIDGAMFVDQAAVVKPGTHPREFIVTAHRADCEELNGL